MNHPKHNLVSKGNMYGPDMTDRAGRVVLQLEDRLVTGADKSPIFHSLVCMLLMFSMQ